MVLRSDNNMPMKEMNEHIKRLVKLAEAYDEKRIKAPVKYASLSFDPVEWLTNSTG